MRVSIIAAVARNGIIGRDGDLPWRLSADLKAFKRRTMGHHLIMGRKTWESVGSLPGRTTIVLSRSRRDLPPGVAAARSLESALEIARRAGDDEAFLAGGGEIYRQGLARADRIYLTKVEADVAGDVTFPELEAADWRELSRCEHGADEKNEHPFSVVVLERRGTQERS